MTRRRLVATLGAGLVPILGALALSVGIAGAQTSSTTSSSTTSSSTTSSSTTSSSSTSSTSSSSTSSTSSSTTTTTQRTSSTTYRPSTTSSSTTSTSTTSTTAVPAVVPPGYKDPGSPSTSFWTSGRKIAGVISMLLVIAVAMIVLNVLYWRHTRPATIGGDGDSGSGGGTSVPDVGLPTGPVGPVDPMVADALRPDPFVTRDDLGLA